MLTSSHFTMFSSVSMLTFVIKKKYSVKLKLLGKKDPLDLLVICWKSWRKK